VRDAAREEAEGHFAEGDRLMAAEDFPGAIAALEAGLALDTESEDLQARLRGSKETAERTMGSARQRVRTKLREGEQAVAVKKWESAIELLSAGLAVEGTRDDELTASLVAALESAQQSMAARDAAREEDVELKRFLNLVSVMAVEFDLQCAQLASVIQQLIRTTETNELTML
jgi:hypothetical protein